MSADAKIWLVIAGLAVATYLIRFSFLGLLAGRRLLGALTRALGFVPVTVLPALIAPMVLSAPGGGLELRPATLVAALAALAFGVTLRHPIAAILAGIAGYAAVRAAGV